MNIQAAWSSSFKNSDFYSFLEDKKSQYPWRVLMILSPYSVEIACVIWSSINIYFEAVEPISEYWYYFASIIVQIISIILLLFWLFINNEPKHIYKTYEFYFFLFICLRFLLTLSYAQKTGVLFYWWNILSILGVAVGILFYLGYDHAWKNSIYRILYSDGYFQEDGKYVVSIWIMDNKKIINAFKKVLLWLFFEIIAFIAVFLFFELITKLFATNPDKIISKTQNQERLNELPILEHVFGSLIKAPILEELFFRQVIMRILGSNMTAVVISSVIFAVTHLSYSEPLHLLALYMVGGFTLSLAYYKYQNLSINIMLHFMWNLLALTAMILKQH